MNIDFKSRLIESRNLTNHMIGTSNSEEVVKQLSTWLFLHMMFANIFVIKKYTRIWQMSVNLIKPDTKI